MSMGNAAHEKGFNLDLRRDYISRRLSELVLSGEISIGNDGNEPDTGEFAILNSPESPPESEGAELMLNTENRLGNLAISNY